MTAREDGEEDELPTVGLAQEVDLGRPRRLGRPADDEQWRLVRLAVTWQDELRSRRWDHSPATAEEFSIRSLTGLGGMELEIQIDGASILHMPPSRRGGALAHLDGSRQEVPARRSLHASRGHRAKNDW